MFCHNYNCKYFMNDESDYNIHKAVTVENQSRIIILKKKSFYFGEVCINGRDCHVIMVVLIRTFPFDLLHYSVCLT